MLVNTDIHTHTCVLVLLIVTDDSTLNLKIRPMEHLKQNLLLCKFSFQYLVHVGQNVFQEGWCFYCPVGLKVM